MEILIGVVIAIIAVGGYFWVSKIKNPVGGGTEMPLGNGSPRQDGDGPFGGNGPPNR